MKKDEDHMFVVLHSFHYKLHHDRRNILLESNILFNYSVELKKDQTQKERNSKIKRMIGERQQENEICIKRRIEMSKTCMPD